MEDSATFSIREFRSSLVLLGFLVVLVWFLPGLEAFTLVPARHEMLEATCAASAFLLSLSAYYRFFLFNERLSLYLFAAFTITGAIDLFHSEIFFSLQSSTENALWLASRTLLPVILLVGFFSSRWRSKTSDSAREFRMLLLIVFPLSAFLLTIFLVWPEIFTAPRAEWGIHRPWELLPALLFLIAVPGFASIERKTNKYFWQLFIPFLLLSIFTQAFMAVTPGRHGSLFATSHLLKLASYGLPLIGLHLDSGVAIWQVFVAKKRQDRYATRLKTQNEELDHLNHQLQEQNTQLKLAHDRITEFNRVLSHDLKAPLRNLDGLIKLVREHSDEETKTRYYDLIGSSLEKMNTMVSGLLMYTRLDRFAPEKDTVTDLAPIIESLIRSEFAFQVETGEAEIEVFGEIPAIPMVTEAAELLFRNLIANALKYNHSHPKRVEIRCEEMPKSLFFSVSDNGDGIQSKHFDRIFKLFSRIQRDDQVSGYGMGLSFCKQLVESHGGKIWVESSGTNGSTFFFTLNKPQTPNKTEENHGHQT